MNLKTVFFLLIGAVLLYGGYHEWGWMGVAGVAGGLVMFLLLNFQRTMKVLQRAGKRPLGYIDSAVMLNARLKPKVTLLHVIAFTSALGEARSPQGADPEVFRWTDPGGSYVDCEFAGGKLVTWTLTRPPVEDDAPAPAAATNPDAPPA